MAQPEDVLVHSANSFLMWYLLAGLCGEFNFFDSHQPHWPVVSVFVVRGKMRKNISIIWIFFSAAGSKAPANSYLNQHHANMFCSPKVTQTSGPTVLFFKVCHWAASVYRFFLNLSLITLTAKRSFYHPWCVKRKISGTSDRCKIWCNFISYWICTFSFSSLNIFPLAALEGIM